MQGRTFALARGRFVAGSAPRAMFS
jgi:hypothetical protein